MDIKRKNWVLEIILIVLTSRGLNVPSALPKCFDSTKSMGCPDKAVSQALYQSPVMNH